MSDRSWVRRAVPLLVVWGASGCESGGKQVQAVLLASPGGDVRMTVSTDTEGRMTYSVTRNGQVEIESSASVKITLPANGGFVATVTPR
jgi:hypothetical protein